MIMVAKKLDEKGQALIEFVFFLPFFALLLILLLSIGNSINGSINQQKVTRSYFYARLHNNSMMPLKDVDTQSNWNQFGMFFIGWAEKFDANRGGLEPVQPCYELKLPFEGEQACNSYDGNSTNFIRVGTVYGLCGATFKRENLAGTGIETFRAPIPNNLALSSSIEGCLIQ